jgi:hypothetical protein
MARHMQTRGGTKKKGKFGDVLSAGAWARTAAGDGESRSSMAGLKLAQCGAHGESAGFNLRCQIGPTITREPGEHIAARCPSPLITISVIKSRPSRRQQQRRIPRHPERRMLDRDRHDGRQAAVVAVENKPAVHPTLPGLLAASLQMPCVVHLLQALSQDVNAAKVSGLVQALETIASAQEIDLQQQGDARKPIASACSIVAMAQR